MNANELWIYDVIGEDQSTNKAVVAALAKADKSKPVTVRLNSPGGIAYEGFAIYNSLRRHSAGVIVEIDAMAASAASYIAMAGDEIHMAEGAFLMIHQCYGGIVGNKEELPLAYESVMGIMSNTDEALVKRYAAKSGKPIEEVDAMLRAETWLSAQQAVEHKFANSVIEDFRVMAFVEESKAKEWKYQNVPPELLVIDAVAAELRKNIASPKAEQCKEIDYSGVLSNINLAFGR